MSLEDVTKIEVRKNAAGRWFWHAMAANRRVIATSGQAFSSEAAAKRAAEQTKAKLAAAPVVVHGPTDSELLPLLRYLIDVRAGRPARSV